MSSLFLDDKGSWVFQFTGSQSKRRTMRLGKITEDDADLYRKHIDHILSARVSGEPLPLMTSQWIANIREHNERLAESMQKHGLISVKLSEKSDELGQFLDRYIELRSSEIKPRTKVALEQTASNLKEYFLPHRRLNDISPGDAKEWRAWLRDSQKLAPNTIRRRCGRAREFFRFAVSKWLITANPFDGMKDCHVKENRSRDHFITRKEAAMVLQACPDAEWKLLFALSRYGGLRCPSEHLALRWRDIDWDRNRFTVHSAKTAQHEGKETRDVPLFPELRPFLEAVDRTGSEYVITRYRSTNSNLRTQLRRIIKIAGLQPWPKLFQNLRATRATELVKIHGVHVAANWMGHSPKIALQNYCQVTEADFESAAPRRAAESAAIRQANEAEDSAPTITLSLSPAVFAAACTSMPLLATYLVAGMGLEPTRP